MVDAENVQRFLTGEPMFAAAPARVRVTTRKVRSGRSGVMLIKSKAPAKFHKNRRTT
jgi:hypothetical protein